MILDARAARMPFPVRALSVDNGSEFMASFEQACADRGTLLLTLPPRSPKLNGSVQRANRTHTEEFYEVTDAEATLADLRPALRAWETVYNTVRPHQALGSRRSATSSIQASPSRSAARGRVDGSPGTAASRLYS